MSLPAQTTELFKRSPALAPLAYVAVLLAAVLICMMSWGYVADHLASLASAKITLQDMKSRSLAAQAAPQRASAGPKGSPFIEGPTVTVAGAALLERVSAAIAKAGGEVLSSQVDLQAVRGGSASVKVTVESNLDQPNLQKLLYDLEAGMPFLFVEQLDAQTLDPTPGAHTERLHVVLSVSGQWLAKS